MQSASDTITMEAIPGLSCILRMNSKKSWVRCVEVEGAVDVARSIDDRSVEVGVRVGVGVGMVVGGIEGVDIGRAVSYVDCRSTTFPSSLLRTVWLYRTVLFTSTYCTVMNRALSRTVAKALYPVPAHTRLAAELTLPRLSSMLPMVCKGYIREI